MKSANIVLSEKTLKAIKEDYWNFEPDELEQIQQALEIFELERKYENAPNGLTPWGEPMKAFQRTLNRKFLPPTL